MTHIYLEIIEQLSDDELATRQPQTLRVECATEDKCLNYYKLVRGLYSDIHYIARIHYCRHDEGKPCSVKNIEEHIPSG